MSTGPNLEVVEVAKADIPYAAQPDDNITTSESNYLSHEKATSSDGTSDVLVGPNGEQYPTEEELKTLKRTYGHVPWLIYTIAFVELCERFAYYGTTAVCKSLHLFHFPTGVLRKLSPVSCNIVKRKLVLHSWNITLEMYRSCKH